MDLAVFGASGRTGRAVLDIALEVGWSLRALVRPSADLDSRPGLVIQRGLVVTAADAEETLAGTQGVICAFGPRPPTLKCSALGPRR